MKYILPIVSFILIFGCTDDQRGGSNQADSNRVVISVDERSLTQGQLQERAEMMLKFRQIQNPAMKVVEMNKIRKDLVSTYPDFFIEHAIWANYAETNKVKVNKKVLQRVRLRAALSASNGKNKKYGVLRSKFGKLSGVLDEHVRMMAVTASAKRYLCDSNPTNFPPDFASNTVKRIKEYNARMTLTNAVIYAQATNCWKELKAGANFVDMVKKYSTIPLEVRDNGEWGTLGLQQLEPDEKIHAFVKANGEGAFSPPIEGDNGLMILRIDGRKDEDYTLSRIFFRLPLFNTVLTEQQVLKMAREKHNARLVEKTFKRLKKAAKIFRADSKKPEVKKSDRKKPGKAKKAKKAKKVSTNDVNRVESKISK